MGPAVPELVVGGREIPLGGSTFRIRLLLAADLTDSLEVSLAGSGPASSSVRAGEPVLFRLGGRVRFRGLVERATAALDARLGASAGFQARPEWFGRAASLPREEEYFQVTDSEVAARIADALGLEARIEATSRVHARLLRRGDPLEFLRERARCSGLVLGIREGLIHFTRKLPGTGGAVLPDPSRTGSSRIGSFELGPHSPVRSLRVSRWAEGRTGIIALGEDPGISPLDRLRLLGLGSDYDGHYRVARVRIDSEPGQTACEVFWLDEGMDPALARMENAP